MGRAVNPAHAREAATQIVRALREAGHTAYFAGGCVRDELLGLSPTDYDVATDATPDRIKSLFKRTDEVGVAFGVVLVHIPVETERVSVEVATFRSDGPYSDKRRPDVIHFSDSQADARRRDFTVNALFLDPLAPDTPSGRIIDYVGGVADLNARLLRAVGDPEARLAEDHLRALRAVRLAAKLGLAIEPATADAIRRRSAGLQGVSRERIGEELRRIMSHPSRGIAIRLLAELHLDGPVADGPHADAPAMSVLDGLPQVAPFATCLAAWSIDRGTDPANARRAADTWRRALCLSNDETDALTAVLVNLRLLRESWEGLPIPTQKRAAVQPGFAEAITLVSQIDSRAAARVRSRVAFLAETPGGLAPPPLLNGDTLVAQGWKPGRAFKRVLDAVYDAQLEGRISTEADALRLAGELARNQGV